MNRKAEVKAAAAAKAKAVAKAKAAKARKLKATTLEQQAGKWDEHDRRCFYAELRAIGVERFYKPGWAAMKYKTIIGEYPPWDWNEEPVRKPTERTLEWVERELAAYARSRSRQQGAAIAKPSSQTWWTAETIETDTRTKAPDTIAKPSRPHAELIDGGCLLYHLNPARDAH
jgi:hypothetical protein